MKFVIMQQLYMSFVFAPPLDRIRPVIRYVLASFSGIASIIPQDGRLLDVGCGDGLLAVYLRKIKKRKQPIVGIDIDERKIRVAEQLSLLDVKFHHKDVAEMPPNSYEVVTVLHVLYLIPLHLREGFVRHCIRVLKPGGSFILVINTDKPKWKYYITFLQELLMVKLLGHTKGETVRFESLDECRIWIARAGAEISTIKRLDRGRPYSHSVVLAHKVLFPNTSISIG
jgi:2-polyprenyl-3-methyl-5-hydroxy-6-metoxy-1,4-benzoquinol methylase